MSYILDTNTFITAKNTYYAYDIVPSFWKVLLQRFSTGEIKTIDAVKKIMQGNDDLAEWFHINVSVGKSVNGDRYVLSSMQNRDVIANYRLIADAVMHDTQYKENYKRSFLSVAAPWLIATAKADNHIVVTLEEMPPNNTTKVKIQAIYRKIGVSCINLYDMMRNLKICI